MIAGALFYYQFHSLKNRLLTRVKRLRQPKYLVGAVVGALYFYYYFFRGLARGRSGGGPPGPFFAQHQDLIESVTALGLMVMMLLAWVLPHSRAALAFTEAEVSFLFSAPIGRRALINFKLLKSQAAILFSAVIMALIGRGWGGGNFVIRGLGWWVLLAVFNLHLLGSSFALTMLMDRGISNWRRRTMFVGAVAGVALAVWLWARNALPAPPAVGGTDYATQLADYGAQVLRSGPLPYLLFPFRLVVAPWFASNFSRFVAAMGPALAIIGLLYWWVARSNVAFEEASLEMSRKVSERIAAARSGNWQSMGKPKKAARAPFVLRPAGNPAVAVFWKNLISAGQFVTARFWLMLVWITVFGAMILQSQSRHAGRMGSGLAMLAVMLLGMSLISGPQMLRNDLRQDLRAADMLKMFPMAGWQVVLGEVLAPAVMLACVQWLLIVLAAIFCPDRLGSHAIPPLNRLSFALAAAAVLPCVDLIAMLIPNASVLFFPAWFQLGKEGPRGFETTGQQLILMFGQMLALVLSLLPAGVAFVVVFICSSFVFGPAGGVVAGGLAAAAILAAEAGVAIKLLGGVFDRFDLSGEIL
jgi:hypothetical protein